MSRETPTEAGYYWGKYRTSTCTGEWEPVLFFIDAAGEGVAVVWGIESFRTSTNKIIWGPRIYPPDVQPTQPLPEKWSPSTLREIMVGDGDDDDFLAVVTAHNRDRAAFIAEVDRLTAELAKYRDAEPLGKAEQIDTGPQPPRNPR